MQHLPFPTTVHGSVIYDKYVVWNASAYPIHEHAGGRACSVEEAHRAIQDFVDALEVPIEHCDIRTRPAGPARPAWKREFDD